MNDPTKGTLLIRPKKEMYEYQEGGTSASITALFPNKIAYEPELGYVLYFEPHIYPIVGLLDPIALNNADVLKKNLKSLLSTIASFPFILVAPIVAIFPMKKFWEKRIEHFSELCAVLMKEFILKPEGYCRAVREIRRAGLEVVKDPAGVHIVKAIAVILENDRPYRYRVQDILEEVNKDNLKASPAKEIKRLVNILSERDQAREWKQIGNLVWLMVKLRPDIRKLIVDILLEIKTENVILDNNDIYWCFLQDGYDFLGNNKEQRAEIHKKL